MNRRLERACKGKTKSHGGLNLDALKKLAEQKGYNGPIIRKDLLEFLCKPDNPPGFLSNIDEYWDVNKGIIKGLDLESLVSLGKTNKYWKNVIDNYFDTLVQNFKNIYPSCQEDCPLSKRKIIEMLFGLDARTKPKIEELEITVGLVDPYDDSFLGKLDIVNPRNKRLVSYSYGIHDLSPWGEQWFQNGIEHRLDAPASLNYLDSVVHEEIWYKDGKRHRVDGPAFIIWHYDMDNKTSVQAWYKDGELHRVDGPATTRMISDDVYIEEYYENDVKVKPDTYRRYDPNIDSRQNLKLK